MATSSKCNCPGNTYQRWKNWRVIARGKCSRLYCLVCRHSWLTRARYAEIMRDHEPRKRSGMTDQNILDRINDGSLIVDVERATVVSVTHKGRTTPKVIERESNGSTYRFVQIHYGGKQKKIALHRLVWIAANGRLPPDGYDVDHRDGPADVIGNLQLKESSQNRSEGAQKRIQNQEAATSEGEF